MTSAPQQHPVSNHKKRITLLGATGSIGDSTLNVIQQHRDRYDVVAMTAHRNAEKLIERARIFRPALVAIADESAYKAVSQALQPMGIKVLSGTEGVREAARYSTDICVSAMVGAAGLLPTMAAIEQGYTVALANKETLVCAGELVMQACLKSGATLLPIDSEHNAIFQVLASEHRDAIEHITITASGGPFLRQPLAALEHATPEQAVAHPRWRMGHKISVDSATMMNKALELIEAHYLFSLPPDAIQVLIHPESIVHALVHYTDGSVLAQLGMPDMQTPIGVALAWPQRLPIHTPRLDLSQIKSLHFEALDSERFPAISLARQALTEGASALIALNAANEVAVAKFLNKEIRFTDIVRTVEQALHRTKAISIRCLDDVLAADHDVRAALA